MQAGRDDRLAIIETVNNWALWRDAGDWERFRTVWHEDGWMTATWFQGPVAKFIEASKAGFDKGVSILHFLGGTSVGLRGERAIAQTKMTISQRAAVEGVPVDVVCTGRFYDFFARRRGQWRIVRLRASGGRPSMVYRALLDDAGMQWLPGLQARVQVKTRTGGILSHSHCFTGSPRCGVAYCATCAHTW